MGGSSFIPGNPEESMIMEYISGEDPIMPQEGDPLTAEEVELFSRWIAETAIDDTPTSVDDTISPSQPPVYTVPPVISALAYSPDGKTLAVSGYREVLLHKSDGSELIGRPRWRSTPKSNPSATLSMAKSSALLVEHPPNLVRSSYGTQAPIH